MNFPLIGLHAWAGEFAALMFIWAFIEVYSGAEKNLLRARRAALLGVLFLFAAWLGGGYYYVVHYGVEVKPAIKAGPMPWGHGVVMETKEHVFLFLPFLGLLALGTLRRYGSLMASDLRARRAALFATGSVAVIAGLMALLGFLVTSSFRASLEEFLA